MDKGKLFLGIGCVFFFLLMTKQSCSKSTYRKQVSKLETVVTEQNLKIDSLKYNNDSLILIFRENKKMLIDRIDSFIITLDRKPQTMMLQKYIREQKY